MKLGDKVIWKDKKCLAALAMGNAVMTVIESHTKLKNIWKVRGPDGYEDYVRAEWVLPMESKENMKWGTYGGCNGQDIEDRKNLIKEIRTETDIAKLGKYIALDQHDYCYDACDSWNELNTSLTNISEACVRRIYEIIGGNG